MRWCAKKITHEATAEPNAGFSESPNDYRCAYIGVHLELADMILQTNRDVDILCVLEGSLIHEAVARMCENKLGIILVIDKKKSLIGTITDGDIRRTILANIDLSLPVEEILKRKEGASQYAKPITAKVGEDSETYLKLLNKNHIRHLPLLDVYNHVVGLVTIDDFIMKAPLPQAVVMAGGKGTRLHPLTEDLPKPMLPVGNKPLLEIIIGQLRSAGIRRVNVATHHKQEKITEHFGNGRSFDVELSYVAENKPLGTAGALGLLDVPKETLLVINGDILTQVDFRAMLQYHREHEAELTIAVRSYDMEVPYGVVECEGSRVHYLKEKPLMRFLVNAGIYLLEPSAHSCIPMGEPYNMTDLIQRLIDEGRSVVSFPIHEYWLDIGEHAEYKLAQEEAGKFND